MNETNPYIILNVDKSATHEEIKKAFHQLAKKYHPDKFTNEEEKKNAHNMFIRIHSAYEILNNSKSKTKYDNLEENDKYFLYKNIYDFILNNPEKIKTYINNILLFLSKDEKYIYHVNKNHYTVAVDLLISQLFKKNTNENINIKNSIECNLSDRYNDNYMYIEIKRITRPNIKLYAPLRNDINIFYDEGEIDDTGKKGDIILNTVTLNPNGYFIKNGDICKVFKIQSIPDVYLYTHLDNIEYLIYKNDIIDEKYFIIKNKGLVKDDGTYGDFIGEFIISSNNY